MRSEQILSSIREERQDQEKCFDKGGMYFYRYFVTLSPLLYSAEAT
jgi:hypothetical protein